MSLKEKIEAERERQVSGEGYAPEQDDRYTGGELEQAALAYELAAEGKLEEGRAAWPLSWHPMMFKTEGCSPERLRVKAGALRLAERDRLERARLKTQTTSIHLN